MSGVARRPWLVPTGAAIAAVAFFVAGVVVWRMTPGRVHLGGHGPTLFYVAPPHRLHPLRAELLWAASAFFALVAITVSRRRRSDAAPTVTA